jgi:hypothetical protein
MEIPQLRGRAIETTVSHVHPRSSFMTKYRKFLLQRSIVQKFSFSFDKFNYLHQNLTYKQGILASFCLREISPLDVRSRS